MNKRRTIVISVFTDASHRWGRAGGGAWVKSSYRPAALYSYPLQAADPAMAEFISACQGLRAAMARHQDLQEQGHRLCLVLQCDNLTTLSAFQMLPYCSPAPSNTMEIPPRYRKLEGIYEQEIQELEKMAGDNTYILLKHVRAHTEKKACRRTYVNEVVDQLARQARHREWVSIPKRERKKIVRRYRNKKIQR